MDTQKANILYIDDEPQNLQVFMASYRKYYNVFTASTAKEALDVLRQNTIEVILTDQRMPDMTGVQFLEAIIPTYPDPVRMLVSGYSDADAIINAINNGRVFRFITKPWDDNELKQNIDIAVKMYRLNLQNRGLIQQMHDEAIKQERILSLFKKYVPAKVVADSISEDPEHLFDGELRVISVLFASIKDINAISEKNDSKKVLAYLNDFFSLMAECVEQYRGVVDKVVGGNLLAIFGAPISSMDNQKNAAFAALCMLERLNEFNKKYESIINHTTEISVGIHSGESIVGNIGSQQYIAYTALGDTVNTASRINEECHQLSNTILVSESINQAVKDDLKTELLDQTKIRGKEKSIALYRISVNKI